MLVTGHHDGTIHVWSAGRGRHLQAIEGAHVMPSSQQQTLASKGGNPAQLVMMMHACACMRMHAS